MKKKTAVEWLLDKLEERKLITLDKHSTIIFHKDFSTPYDFIVHQAKAMEKEQIIEAHGLKREHGIENGVDYWITKCGLEYYDQTYK
jgi:hypothetical protein